MQQSLGSLYKAGEIIATLAEEHYLSLLPEDVQVHKAEVLRRYYGSYIAPR